MVVHEYNQIIWYYSVNRNYNSATIIFVHATASLPHMHSMFLANVTSLSSSLIAIVCSFPYFWVGVLACGANSSPLILLYRSKSLKPLSVVLYRFFVESYSSKPLPITSSRYGLSWWEDKYDEYMILVFLPPCLAASSMLTIISLRLLFFMTKRIALTCYFRISS